MATLEEAERVRDLIADQLLNEPGGVSVGIRKTGDGYAVGVTSLAGRFVLPELPSDLWGVEVQVRLTDSPGQLHRR